MNEIALLAIARYKAGRACGLAAMNHKQWGIRKWGDAQATMQQAGIKLNEAIKRHLEKD